MRIAIKQMGKGGQDAWNFKTKLQSHSPCTVLLGQQDHRSATTFNPSRET